MAKLKAITQPLPLAKLAYERLRDSIIHGQLLPGEVYNEMALAKDLGISRTPVREALLELSAQGLVSFLPRKGVMIRNFTLKDVKEIFELRRAIELTAVDKVARANPPCDLSNISEHIKDQKKAVIERDFTAFMKADRAFHAGFCELADNKRLVKIVENVRDLVHYMGMQGLDKKGRAEAVITEHEKIYEAIAKRNPIKARKAMEIHLKVSEQAVLEHYRPGEEQLRTETNNTPQAGRGL
jgi:GntR family transcriptional regulator, rspAB operon transcriptional repressor